MVTGCHPGGYRPPHLRLQATTPTVAGYYTYGCRAPHLRLQGTIPTVAGHRTYGCRAPHLRLQARLSRFQKIAASSELAAERDNATRLAEQARLLTNLTILYFTLQLYYFTSQRHAARGAGNRAVLATKLA